jgi:spore maturation protein B
VSLLLDLYKEAGCDSFAGRAASIIMSCTETVFYTMTVYFGAVRIKKTRYTLAGALFSSLVGMTVGVLLARLI